jgi:hypothetical protein
MHIYLFEPGHLRVSVQEGKTFLKEETVATSNEHTHIPI